ncbi:hypothetical protein [Glutamicibacter halophytocola]|uniref:hypothetical protein n=1 Tax=Glutamicibacter halophytocola TaxID=1933880 RepID=UPI0015C56D18|nr:hypothetical protein [Glutamicibacter halophytocola]NQD41435.1 hypothetical protein [Glutamicibacter halophytocola]
MNMKLRAQELIDNYANDNYINAVLGLSLEAIKEARQGIFGDEFIEHEDRKVETAKTMLTPVTRPFPKLTPDMSDTEKIVILAKHGLSAHKIQPYLSTPIDKAVISRNLKKVLGPVSKESSSKENAIHPSFMVYVVEALDRLGKDRYTCEICLDPVPKGCVVHHTKYEGATVYDLMYICQSCNLSRTNRGLK